MKPKSRIPLIVGFLIITLLGFGYYLNQILIPDYRRNQVVLENQKQLLAIRKQELAQIQELDRNFDRIKVAVETALIALPSETQLIDIPYQLASIADAHNLQNFNWSLSTQPVTIPRSTIQALGINISFIGNYDEIISYLDYLGNSLRLININNISISGSTSLEEASGALSVSMQANAYFTSD
ncbi:MAG TPA: hypothetical protein ENN77_01885 [Candidatus Wirthbacteria bacterium]|nr:hypothetical protein [Candidatus Wirthbacteria bacterium]